MKNVFIINSHTTFLTAIGTIVFLKLKKDNVILITMRHFSSKLIRLECRTYDISDIEDKYALPQVWRNEAIRKAYINDIDNFIQEKIKDQFILFAPHFSHPLFQSFYTSQLCHSGNYIQEGGIPFKNAYRIKLSLYETITSFLINKFFLRTSRIWMPHGWYVEGKLYKNTQINSYATSDQFFKYLPSNNHIIKWPKVEVDITIEEGACVFIFDGFVQNKFVERDFYIESCKKMIIQHSKEHNYLRFHPSQTIEDKKEICSIFEKNHFQYIIMDSDIPFELILSSTNQRLTVVGLGSSLLFFARDFGHTVICHDRWLVKSKYYRRYKKECGFLFFDEI